VKAPQVARAANGQVGCSFRPPELEIRRIGSSQVVQIADLTDQIGRLQQRPFIMLSFLFARDLTSAVPWHVVLPATAFVEPDG
jgi:hypothetical protein